MHQVKVTLSVQELVSAGAKELSKLPFDDLKKLKDCMQNDWQAKDGKMRIFWEKIFNAREEDFRLSPEDQQQAKEWISFFDQISKCLVTNYLPRAKQTKEDDIGHLIYAELVHLPHDKKNDFDIAHNTHFLKECFEDFLEKNKIFFASHVRIAQEDRWILEGALNKLTEASTNAFSTFRKVHQIVFRKTFLGLPFKKPSHIATPHYQGRILNRN